MSCQFIHALSFFTIAVVSDANKELDTFSALEELTSSDITNVYEDANMALIQIAALFSVV